MYGLHYKYVVLKWFEAQRDGALRTNESLLVEEEQCLTDLHYIIVIQKLKYSTIHKLKIIGSETPLLSLHEK